MTTTAGIALVSNAIVGDMLANTAIPQDGSDSAPPGIRSGRMIRCWIMSLRN